MFENLVRLLNQKGILTGEEINNLLNNQKEETKLQDSSSVIQEMLDYILFLSKRTKGFL